MTDLLIATDRRPFEWVEIDQPKCALAYGSSPCQAVLGTTGDSKCYNTRHTCQDPTNYDQSEIVTLRFARNQQDLPDDFYYFPYLESARVAPAKINPGGGKKNTSALGMRGEITLRFADHPHTDEIVDPYISERLDGTAQADGVGFNPFERSTFWSKWRARNPYYMQREIRHKSGFIDPETRLPDPSTLITRTFFLTGFSGENSDGGVVIKGQDLLTLSANEKAKAPTVNTGTLQADITDSATSLTLQPPGIGDLQYASSGSARIGREVVTFTRSGDTMTIVRGTSGTTAEEHKTNDVVQECLIYTAQRIDDILYNLLNTYAGIDASFLDTSQWQTEVDDHLPSLYTTIITEPTGVNQLITEMCEQMFFTTYWQEREALQKIRAVRPPEDEEIVQLTDAQHLLEDSIKWRDDPDALITQVWVYFAQIDPTEKLDKTTNYGALEIVVDSESESVTRNNVQKIKRIYSRWITGTNGGAAISLGRALLARYNNIPRDVSFSVDAKDRDLWLADFVELSNRNVVDAQGIAQPVQCQVISAQEAVPGTRYSYQATQYIGTPIEANPDELLVVISVDTLNLNLRDAFDDAYGVTPGTGTTVRFIIKNGVTIGGSSISSFDTSLNKVIEGDYTYTGDVRMWRNPAGARIESIDSMKVLQRKGLLSATSYAIDTSYTDAHTGTTGTLNTDCEEVPLSTAIETGTWPAGVELFLDVEAGALVLGEGGNGSNCFIDPWYAINNITQTEPKLVRGGDGGHALKIDYAITINNQGVIAAGGGGGMGAANRVEGTYSDGTVIFPGGGGAGYVNSKAPKGLVNLTAIGSPQPDQLNESQTTSGGNKEQFGIGHNGGVSSGNGGGLAEDGVAIASGNGTHDFAGVAGNAINGGADLVTWTNKGDVRGTEVI